MTKLFGQYDYAPPTYDFLNPDNNGDIVSQLLFGNQNPPTPGSSFNVGVTSDPLGAQATKGGLFENIGGLEGLNNILGSATNLAGIFAGFKQLGLMKDAFNFQKDLANKNLANQTASYNTALSDRQRARNSAGPGYQSVGEYMKENALSV